MLCVSWVSGMDPCGLIVLWVPLMTAGVGMTHPASVRLTKGRVSLFFLGRALPVPWGLQS